MFDMTSRRFSTRQLNQMNGLVTCKLGCDVKYPFNKDKRQACKTACEDANISEATSTYGSGGSGSSERIISGDTSVVTVDTTNNEHIYFNVNNNTKMRVWANGLVNILYNKFSISLIVFGGYH